MPTTTTGRVLVALVLGLSAAAARVAAQPLTVDRIASLPRLAGTPPAAPAWSPDGQHVAFLWNDQGMPFRDVWVYSVAGRQVRRLTDARALDVPSARRTPPEGPDAIRSGAVAASLLDDLSAQAAARADGGVTEFGWRPDSRAVVFVRRGRLLEAGLDGGTPVPVDGVPVPVSAVRFSPDGRFLSFVSQGSLCLLPRAGGTVLEVGKRFSPGTAPGVALSSYEWSPDARTIAVMFADEGRSRTLLFPDYLPNEVRVRTEPRDYTADKNSVEILALYRVEPATWQMVALEGTRERITSNYSWSRDGRSLLVDRNGPDAPCRWIEVVAAKDGAVREAWKDPNPNRSYTTPWFSAWRSDGAAILFLTDLDGWVHLHSIPVEGGSTPVQLTRGPWEIVHSSGYSPVELQVTRGGDVFFIATERNPQERQVYRVSERGGEVVQVSSRPGTYAPLVSPDGSRLAMLHSDDVTPPELFVRDLGPSGDGSERRVTRSPLPDFDRHAWATPEYVAFRSHVDGVEIHGRLLLPPNLDRRKRHPVILGPVYLDTSRNQWQDRWSLIQQYLVTEARYIVLQIDSRGSSGHGAAFRHAFQYRCGTIDIDDLESGVRYLSTLPFVDTSRVGIWGTSYGGLMTVQALFKKPGLFAAGVAGAPATNVWHAGVSEYRLFGDPVTHADSYREGSAFSFGERLQDHLMIVHGMQDSTVLFRDSVALVEKLLLLGKDVDLVVAPSAVHAWTQKDYNARFLLTKLVDHFDRYVGRGGR